MTSHYCIAGPYGCPLCYPEKYERPSYAMVPVIQRNRQPVTYLTDYTIPPMPLGEEPLQYPGMNKLEPKPGASLQDSMTHVHRMCDRLYERMTDVEIKLNEIDAILKRVEDVEKIIKTLRRVDIKI